VQNRITTGSAVAASAEHNAQPVGAKVEKRLAPFVELKAGTVKKLIDGFGKLLETSGQTMREAEEAYIEELADDVKPRSDRDAADADGRVLWSSVQKAVSEAFGQDGVRIYGMAAPLPTKPAELAERLKTTIAFLKKKPAKGKDLLDNEVDTAKLAAKLTAVHTRLVASLKSLVKEERERQTAIGRRDDAVAAWTTDYQGIANALIGLYLLAGERGAAEWLRPTVRKTVGFEASVPEEERNATTEPDEPAPGGEPTPA
jgi:hypothetical protein